MLNVSEGLPSIVFCLYNGKHQHYFHCRERRTKRERENFSSRHSIEYLPITLRYLFWTKQSLDFFLLQFIFISFDCQKYLVKIIARLLLKRDRSKWFGISFSICIKFNHDISICLSARVLNEFQSKRR